MRVKLVLIGCLTCIAFLGMMPVAYSDSSWNGTWIGNWETGNGTQITFAGNEFISIYWDGDYVPDATGVASPDGKVVTITWKSGSAVLTRKGPTAIDIVIHEKGKKDVSFALKPDG